MKDFKIDKNGNYICEECGNIFQNKRGLSSHIQFKHNQLKYYLNYRFEDEDDTCKVCKEKTKFISAIRGFKNFCSIKHRHEFKQKTQKQNNIRLYGVKHTWQRKDVKDKIKETHKNNWGGIGFAVKELKNKISVIKKEKYGNENYTNRKKAAKTNLKKYGNENYTNRKKAAKTNLKKYGNISPLWGKEQHKKTIQTWKEKYGVENPQQNIEILNKGFKTRRTIHQFRDTNLTYQGSYELDFLEKFYDKIDIENGPSIPYLYEGKNKVYHSDFYIPSKNLIVEIKSSYILKLDNEINEKKEECLKKGYDYILILEKRYSRFKKLIHDKK